VLPIGWLAVRLRSDTSRASRSLVPGRQRRHTWASRG
jgi:hypothetical protein